MSTDPSLQAQEDQLPELRFPSGAPISRSAAITDLVFAVSVVLVSLPWASPSDSLFRNMRGVGAALALAAFQFSAEGLVPLLLIAVRGERLAAYGFRVRNAGKSIALAAIFSAVYDLGLSWHAGAWLWIPLRRHTAVRMSLAAGFPWNLAGLVVAIAVWGIIEAFFGVFFAKRVNQMLGQSGKGWLSPGALAFAVFNGALHLAVGQGVAGFVTSFASGYAIGVIPAVTGNAWGSAVFQSLTNAVGRI